MDQSLKHKPRTAHRQQVSTLRRLLGRIRGEPIEFSPERYRWILPAIDPLRLQFQENRNLASAGLEIAARVRSGGDDRENMAHLFAFLAEVSRRELNIAPFAEQFLAGTALADGRLVEMATGEGKTLAAIFSAAWHALLHPPVFIFTANDYLAGRDAVWMSPCIPHLGLRVGAIQAGLQAQERRRIYASDVIYMTTKECGFDFLRDQIAPEPDDILLPSLQYAIVDEADFIMIDEARIPLVLAGDTDTDHIDPHRMARVARQLTPGRDFLVLDHGRNVELTDAGAIRAERLLGCGNLYETGQQPWFASLNVALHAEALLQRDIDYIVRNGKLELVDLFTGRVAEQRRWPYGLQTALEAKEGLCLAREGKTYATITIQHFLQLFPRLAAMTATALPAAREFHQFYELETLVIPPHRPCIRLDHDDLIFPTMQAKIQALLAEIGGVHATGRPILVGTASIAESEFLAAGLLQNGIICRVLNARNDGEEASIIARAGRLGAVTISTNMAGRGTDIRLGGGEPVEAERVSALGGLYVIGTNRYESRRIDDQLRGRAGRQGDPGASRFFISLEDDLFVRFQLSGLIPKELIPERTDQPVDHPVVSREIARVQRIIENQNLDIRKTLWKYSVSIESNRRDIQARRDTLLRSRSGEGLAAVTGNRRYDDLLPVLGNPLLQKAERDLLLHFIDFYWCEYLARVADIREGIHLQALGGYQPWYSFQKQVDDLFSEMEERIAGSVREFFDRVRIDGQGIDFAREGLTRPSSTWTYLITDNPYGDSLRMALLSQPAMAAAVASQFWLSLPILLGLRLFGGKNRKKRGRHPSDS